MAVKESYVFNAAFVTKRFKDLETLDKTTFNAHKLIDFATRRICSIRALEKGEYHIYDKKSGREITSAEIPWKK